MTMPEIAAAMRRAQAVFARRPAAGLHDDAPASACWREGTRVITRHADGASIESDMPRELGGHGELPTPGWLFRAGLAACTATRIAMSAAAHGIDLEALEVVARSRSDARGLFGMSDADGAIVDAGPGAVRLDVRIVAPGVPAERLRELVAEAQHLSPVTRVAENATPVAVHVVIG
jgi:uncharacterized OsmC-like protein